MKDKLTRLNIIIFCLCSTFTAFAQNPGATDTGGTLEATDAPAAPIDNYVWVLALVGLVFVFLKLKDIKNKNVTA